MSEFNASLQNSGISLFQNVSDNSFSSQVSVTSSQTW